MTKKSPSTSRRTKERKEAYLLELERAWPTILRAYHDFKARRPIIEYRVREDLVCAFPASAYLDGLTKRTREQTRKMHERATATGRIVVFVSDSREQVLRSYVFAIEAPGCAESKRKTRVRRKRITA